MKRIIELSHKYKLAHIGSCLTMYPILKNIYMNKSSEDIVVLSAGHAGIAQYVLLEELYGHDADDLYLSHGVHPHRDIDRGIHVSSGSLGSAILIAVGMALANKNKTIHCAISDGECAEGSVWEALSFIYLNKLTNIKIHVNINGYSALDKVDTDYLIKKLQTFLPDIIIWKTSHPNIDFMDGLKAHYYILNDKDKEILCDLI